MPLGTDFEDAILAMLRLAVLDDAGSGISAGARGLPAGLPSLPHGCGQPRLTEQKGEEQSIRGALNRGLLRPKVVATTRMVRPSRMEGALPQIERSLSLARTHTVRRPDRLF